MKISARSKKPKDDTAKDHFIATMSIVTEDACRHPRTLKINLDLNLSSSPETYSKTKLCPFI